MRNSSCKNFCIKIFLILSVAIYMSYNICVNINYIIYYKDVINKNKSLYLTLINDKKYKEEKCSEIIEKINKEKNCKLSEIKKDDSKSELEVNVSYIGKIEELNDFILRTSKEKSFQDIKYIHICNSIPQSHSEIKIIFKI